MDINKLGVGVNMESIPFIFTKGTAGKFLRDSKNKDRVFYNNNSIDKINYNLNT